jgi:hypothetical protein
MTIVKTNPITGHLLTLMPPTTQRPEPFGWIELLNGGKAGGYIYLETTLKIGDPHLSGDGSYIVTAMPMAALPVLLDILRNEKNMQIRYFDPQAPNVAPSVFLEPAVSVAGDLAEQLRIPPEIKERLEQFRTQPASGKAPA